MKIIELVTKYNWNEIYLDLLQFYPDQDKNLEGYKQVFETLRTVVPVETKMRLSIESILDEITNENYNSVSGRESSLDNQESSYAIEFTDWAEWLGMEIDSETLSTYTETAILAHCLWEMTFFGYNEEDIKRVLTELQQPHEGGERLTLTQVKQELDVGDNPNDEVSS